MWPYALPWIVEACKSSNGRYLSIDIKKMLLSREGQLWLALRDGEVLCVCVTEIIKYPRKMYASVMILTGKEREAWQELYKWNIEAWALAEGCDGVESLARKGWAKVFKDYQCNHVQLERDF